MELGVNVRIFSVFSQGHMHNMTEGSSTTLNIAHINDNHYDSLHPCHTECYTEYILHVTLNESLHVRIFYISSPFVCPTKLKLT